MTLGRGGVICLWFLQVPAYEMFVFKNWVGFGTYENQKSEALVGTGTRRFIRNLEFKKKGRKPDLSFSYEIL